MVLNEKGEFQGVTIPIGVKIPKEGWIYRGENSQGYKFRVRGVKIPRSANSKGWKFLGVIIPGVKNTKGWIFQGWTFRIPWQNMLIVS